MAKLKNFEFSDVYISKSDLIDYLYTTEFNKFRNEVDISDDQAVEQVLENIKKKIKQGFTGRTNELTKEYLEQEANEWLHISLEQSFEAVESSYFRNNP
jgi:hypothetical protein